MVAESIDDATRGAEPVPQVKASHEPIRSNNQRVESTTVAVVDDGADAIAADPPSSTNEALVTVSKQLVEKIEKETKAVETVTKQQIDIKAQNLEPTATEAIVEVLEEEKDMHKANATVLGKKVDSLEKAAVAAETKAKAKAREIVENIRSVSTYSDLCIGPVVDVDAGEQVYAVCTRNPEGTCPTTMSENCMALPVTSVRSLGNATIRKMW